MNKLTSAFLFFVLMSITAVSIASKDPTVTLPGKIEPISVTDNGDGTTTAEFYYTDSGSTVETRDAVGFPPIVVTRQAGNIINYLGEFQVESRVESAWTNDPGELNCPTGQPRDFLPAFGFTTYPYVNKAVTVISESAGTLTFTLNKEYFPIYEPGPIPAHGSSGFCWDPSDPRWGWWYIESEVEGTGIYSCVQSGKLVLDGFNDLEVPPNLTGLPEFMTSNYISTGSSVLPVENRQIVTLTYDNGCL